MPAYVSERRRDGQRQSSVDFFRGHERHVRRSTALAFSPEGDADVAESTPARARGRRVPSRPDEFLLQETDHGDEHCQRVSALRVARCPRQSVKRLRQGRSPFSQGRCGLFGSDLTAFRWTPLSSGKTFGYSAVPRCLSVPLILLYVHVVRGGQFIPVTGWAGESSRANKGLRGGIMSKSISRWALRSKLFGAFY